MSQHGVTVTVTIIMAMKAAQAAVMLLWLLGVCCIRAGCQTFQCMLNKDYGGNKCAYSAISTHKSVKTDFTKCFDFY